MKDFRNFERSIKLTEHYHNREATSNDEQQIALLRKLAHQGNKQFVPTSSSLAVNSYLKAIRNDIKSQLVDQRDRLKKPNNLSSLEYNALIRLQDDTSITIKPADKGGKIVIMNRLDYNGKCLNLLEDESHYKKIDVDALQDITDNVLTTLRNLSSVFEPSVIKFLTAETNPLGRFYGLPKIHKRNTPLRPIVSASGTLLENASLVIDFLIKDLPQSTPSYVKDTNHFLQIIKNISLPSDKTVIMATMDVSSLYTVIPQNDGITSTLCYYKKQYDSLNLTVTPDTLETLMKLVLENNTFEFGNINYLQISGTSMGTRMAPSYAILFMAKLEENFMKYHEEKYQKKPMVYVRYIDDIFLLWEHDQESLENFILEFNNYHPSIKFTNKISHHSLEFLDVQVNLKNHALITTLFRKPTDCPSYLHFNSEHPRHQKVSIPYSLALRCKRICSDPEDARRQANHTLQLFHKRGYPTFILNDAFNKAMKENTTRGSRTNNSTLKELQPINFILTYNRFLPNFNAILKKHFSILQGDSRTKNVFITPPRVVYRKPKSLRNYLVRAREQINPEVRIANGCEPCNKPRCLCCLKMLSTKTVIGHFSNFKFNILGNYNCQSKNVVYMLKCSVCNKEYIGQTSTQFNIRINNHKSHCKTQQHLSISRHTNEQNHDFSNFKYVILKGNFKTDLDREIFESFAIQMFKSKTYGLNEDYGICSNLFT